jgi:TonB family protein
LKTALCFLRVATAVLLCIGFGGYRSIAEPPIQVVSAGANAANAANAVSLVVCDSQTFDNCHRVGGVTRPRVLHGATPVYPLAAQRLKLEGVSVVRLVIDTHGVPRNVTTAHSIAETAFTSHRDVAAEVDRSAVECVKKFRFAPATLDGKPVATEATLKMTFHHTTGK